MESNQFKTPFREVSLYRIQRHRQRLLLRCSGTDLYRFHLLSFGSISKNIDPKKNDHRGSAGKLCCSPRLASLPLFSCKCSIPMSPPTPDLPQNHAVLHNNCQSSTQLIIQSHPCYDTDHMAVKSVCYFFLRVVLLSCESTVLRKQI